MLGQLHYRILGHLGFLKHSNTCRAQYRKAMQRLVKSMFKFIVNLGKSS